MKSDFENLRIEFEKIKKKGLIKSLRNGSTGVGYTFETLLGKKEDQESKPDFEGIEIKTKYGYSHSPITLFRCAPKRNKESATEYLFNKYSYQKINSNNIKLLCLEVNATEFERKYNYSYKLKIDYLGKFIAFQVFQNDEFIEDICFWDFKDLQTKLEIKMKKLALIEAYPYRKPDGLYYKYLKMSSYKLKGFFEFLKLIEDGKIDILIYLTKDISNKDNKINNGGYSFRLHTEDLTKLYYKIY